MGCQARWLGAKRDEFHRRGFLLTGNKNLFPRFRLGEKLKEIGLSFFNGQRHADNLLDSPDNSTILFEITDG